jgi:hypothetical protein
LQATGRWGRPGSGAASYASPEIVLVITDVVMPGMGARELAELMKALCQNVRALQRVRLNGPCYGVLDPGRRSSRSQSRRARSAKIRRLVRNLPPDEVALWSDEVDVHLNPYAERWVGLFKQECLDRFMVFGERHLRHIVESYAAYYNAVRPNKAAGYQPIAAGGMPGPESVEILNGVACESWLGGILRHYRRAA